MPLLRRQPTRHPSFEPLRVVAVDPVAEHAVSIGFDVSGSPRFRDLRAGQYVTLRAHIDGQDVRQSYSVWVPPSRVRRDEVVRVAAAAVQGGRMSPWLATAVEVGDTIAVLPPLGEFVLDESVGARRHVGVVGGSGITPVLAIAAAALEQDPGSSVDLVVANRTRASTVLRRELEELAAGSQGRLRVTHVLSRESVDGVRHGRITPELLTEVVGPVSGVDEWWLCGPEGLIADIEHWLGESGVEHPHIHRERFTSTGPVDPRPDTGAEADAQRS